MRYVIVQVNRKDEQRKIPVGIFIQEMETEDLKSEYERKDHHLKTNYHYHDWKPQFYLNLKQEFKMMYNELKRREAYE